MGHGRGRKEQPTPAQDNAPRRRGLHAHHRVPTFCRGEEELLKQNHSKEWETDVWGTSSSCIPHPAVG